MSYILRKDIGQFPKGTPAEIIRDHPAGAVGVKIQKGNTTYAFTMWKSDLEEINGNAVETDYTQK